MAKTARKKNRKAQSARSTASRTVSRKQTEVASSQTKAKSHKPPPAPVAVPPKNIKPFIPEKPLSETAPVVLPTPVPTDGKPRKNQAGLSPRELEHFRQLLLAKRREILGDMTSMEREALRSTTSTNLSNLPIHMADMGTDNYEQEFTLGLVEKDRQLLREINVALAKIQDGTYGICEGTGKPISKARLEAQPWARYSIEYARELEKGGVRR